MTKVLRGPLLAAAAIVLATAAYADGEGERGVANLPKNPGMFEAVGDASGAAPKEAPAAATGELGDERTVYSNLNSNGYFHASSGDAWMYDDILLASEGDLAIFRHLSACGPSTATGSSSRPVGVTDITRRTSVTTRTATSPRCSQASTSLTGNREDQLSAVSDN